MPIEERQLAAIMFTDMVDYSALSQKDEALALELLEEHRRILREVLARFHGTEIKTIGDAFLLQFRSALEAVQCAIEVQRTFAKRNHDVPSERRIELRIGIHLGDVVHRDGDVYGDGVNIASRIEPLAAPGGICISEDVERQVRSAVDVRVEKLAPAELKNIQLPMALFRLVLGWEQRPAVVAPSKSKERPMTKIAIAALVLIALLASAAFWWLSRDRAKVSGRPATPDKSIAVLPFVDMSQDKDQEYFSDGIAEELLNRLAQLPDLKVAARTSAFQFRGRNLDMAEIGRQLKVGHVLEGSVRKSGGNLRISAQLIQCDSGYHIWSQIFDRAAADVFKVQDEIAGAIATALEARLGGKADSAKPAASADPAAYDDYLQARAFLARRTGDNLKQALAAFDRAIARDRNYSPAHSGRAFTLAVSVSWGLLLPMRELPASIIASANEAVRLDPENAEAYLVRGVAKSTLLRENEARADLDRAYALAPGSVNVLNLLGDNYRITGNLRTAERMKRQAMALDPLALVHPLNLAAILRSQGRFSEAEAMARRAQALEDDAFAYDELFWAQLGMGKLDAARQSLRTLCSKVGTEGRGCLIGTVALYAAEGRPAAEMAPMLARLSAGDWHGIDTAWLGSYEASLYANQLRDIPRATVTMRKSLANLDFCITPPLLYGPKGARLPEEISRDPEWLAFWTDPKLRELMDTYRANLTAFRNGK
jgi:adenylate cyclase